MDIYFPIYKWTFINMNLHLFWTATVCNGHTPYDFSYVIGCWRCIYFVWPSCGFLRWCGFMTSFSLSPRSCHFICSSFKVIIPKSTFLTHAHPLNLFVTITKFKSTYKQRLPSTQQKFWLLPSLCSQFYHCTIHLFS